MNTQLKNYWVGGFVLLILIGFGFGANYYLRSAFYPGQCVQALDGVEQEKTPSL